MTLRKKVIKNKNQKSAAIYQSMKKLLIIFTLTFTISLSAQVAPSPSAMSTINFSNSGDLYRGQISEVVPIYTVEAENGYQLPVQLIYQTRGIKVDDVASSVGLGWDLLAGGAITRVMKDEPDDQSSFVNTPNATSVRHSEYDELAGKDYQKDIFYFSFPGGGGSFVHSGNNMQLSNANGYTSFYGLPYTDIKIKFFRTSSTDSYWELTDTKGVVYRFGNSVQARELTTTRTQEVGQLPKNNADFTYISTWYLERIIFPNLPASSDIILTYEKDGNSINNVSNSESMIVDLEEDQTYWYHYRLEGTESFADYFTLRRKDKWSNESTEYNIPNTGNVIEPGTGMFGPKIPGLYDYKVFEKVCEDNPNIQEQDCYQTYNGGSFTFFPDPDHFINNLVNPNDYKHSPFVTYKKSANAPHSQKSYTTTTTIHTSSLVSIESLKAVITFNNQPREDYPGLSRIQNIEVRDHLNELVNSFELGHEYFDSRDLHNNGVSGDIYNKRLKLSYVKQNGVLVNSFNYKNEEDASLELPARGDIQKDKYGYYKSGVSSQFSPYTVRYSITDPFIYEYDIPINIGSNRSPNGDSRANMLWKVNYPTGGYKELTYGTKVGGGVTIESVKLKQQDGELISHNSYTYTGGRAMSAGLHAIGDNEVIFFSTSPYLTFDHQSLAGYRNVTVKNELTGMYTFHEFETPYVTDESEKSKWQLSGSSWTNLNDDKVFKGSAPMMSPPILFKGGQPRLIESYDSNEDLVSSVFYKYLDGAIEQTINEHGFLQSSENSGHFYQGKSQLKLRPFYLDYTEKTSFDEAENPILQVKTEVDYHSDYKTLPAVVTTSRIDTNVEKFNSKTYTYYPSDYDDVDLFMDTEYGFNFTVLDDMVASHMIGVPLAQRYEVSLPEYQGTANEYRVNKIDFTVYKKFSNRVFPHKSYTYNFPKPYIYGTVGYYTVIDPGPELISTMNYNAQGLLSSVLSRDGITSNYLYDAQGYLTSKTINPGVVGMEQTTTYTYKPLVGVETVTDPTNETITNVYDSRNRLYYVMDSDENIIKRYRYNYGNEANEIAADLHISGTNLTGQTLTFSAKNVHMYGTEAEYKWRIDGTTYTGQSITQTFNSSGPKSVTLNIINAEYDEPYESTAFIVFFDQMISPTITGDTTFDACTYEQGDGVTFYPSLAGAGATCINGSSPATTSEWFYRAGSGNYVSLGQTGEFPEHLLQLPGNYTIKLELTDGCGNVYTDTHPFTVTGNCGGFGGIE